MIYDIDLLKYFVIWIIIIVVHELGHYFAFKYYKHNATIKIKWWGAIFIGQNVNVKKISQSVIILIWGVIAGLVPTILLFFEMTPYMRFNGFLLYFLLSMVDIGQIVVIMNLPKNERGMTWLDYHICQAEKLKKLEA